MMRNDVIHVRVSDELKANVESILSDLGITLSYAVNMYLKQIEAKRGIPFDVVLPSQEKSREVEMLAKAINLTGGKEVSSYANRILSLYAQELIDYETAVFALGRNL
jgi:DNA-damage-inducible protein J